MYIDVSQEPPPELFRKRIKYIRLALSFLLVAGGGVLLAIYQVFSDASSSQTLEDVALALIVGPGLVFVYFAEKLMAYKSLSEEQGRQLAELITRNSLVAIYCARVEKAGRQVILAEFEACQGAVENLARK